MTENGLLTKPKISKDLVAIRAAIPSDKNFIYSTWLKGLYYGNEWFRDIDQDLYFDCYSKVIGHIIAKPETEIRVACLADDPEVILSYVILEKKEDESRGLHWAFTKSSWRRLGLLHDLIPVSTNECSHLTKLGKIIKPKHWMFNPFRV